MRTSLRLLAFVIVSALFIACGGSSGGGSSSSSSSSTSTGGKLVFGAPVSLTGSTAKEGLQTKNGYELWAEAVNKAGGIKVGDKTYTVELKILDDQSSGETSAQLAEKLIKEEKVNFLLGPYGTTPTFNVSRVAEQNGIPM